MELCSPTWLTNWGTVICSIPPNLAAIVHIAAPINLHLHIRRRGTRTRGAIRHPNKAIALLSTVHAIARCDVAQ